jgi:hypothetical protein
MSKRLLITSVFASLMLASSAFACSGLPPKHGCLATIAPASQSGAKTMFQVFLAFWHVLP